MRRPALFFQGGFNALYRGTSVITPVGEGHDPPGSAQKQIVPCFGEFEPNSLRIRPKWLEIAGACRREGHDPPLRAIYKFQFTYRISP